MQNRTFSFCYDTRASSPLGGRAGCGGRAGRSAACKTPRRAIASGRPLADPGYHKHPDEMRRRRTEARKMGADLQGDVASWTISRGTVPRCPLPAPLFVHVPLPASNTLINLWTGEAESDIIRKKERYASPFRGCCGPFCCRTDSMPMPQLCTTLQLGMEDLSLIRSQLPRSSIQSGLRAGRRGP